MRTGFRKSFERDLKKLAKDRQTRDRVREAIEQVEAVPGLQELPNVRKLGSGSGDF